MITLGFNGNLNSSINVGDSVYYVITDSVGGFTTATIPSAATSDNPILLGTISSIQTNDNTSPFYTTNTLIVYVDNVAPGTTVETIINIDEDGDLQSPPDGSFIFFSKDNKYNMSSLSGYYGEVQFKNNSTTNAELFATSCEIVESSK